MVPKGRSPLSKSDRLAEVDAELESAMERLTETNERIDGLLSDFEDKPEEEEPEEEEKDKAGPVPQM